MTSTATSPILDQHTLRRVFGSFPTGVVAIAADVDGEPTGLAASSFVPVSIDPPLVAFCIQHTSSTWPRLRRAAHLGVSVLGQGHGTVVRTLASKTGDRFAGVDTRTNSAGCIFVEDAACWLDTTIQGTVPAGDHDIVLLRVEQVAVMPDVEPIIFHASDFRQLAQVSA